MLFLMLLVFGFVHMAMLATTKLIVNFAAFSAGRAAMIGRSPGASAQAGAASALQYLKWSPVPIATVGQRTFRGKTRAGARVSYRVPFGLPLYNNLPFGGLEIVAFSPFTVQPGNAAAEEGDNAAR